MTDFLTNLLYALGGHLPLVLLVCVCAAAAAVVFCLVIRPREGCSAARGRLSGGDAVLMQALSALPDDSPAQNDPSHNGGGTSGGGIGDDSNSGGNGGNGGTVTPDPDPVPTPTPTPDPIIGGDVTNDPGDSDKSDPSLVDGNHYVRFDEKNFSSSAGDSITSDDIEFTPSSSTTFLYTGQVINERLIYNALDTIIRDPSGKIHAWGTDDLGEDNYVRITAVSFNGEEGPWYDLSEHPTLTIPDDAENMYIKAAYRLRRSDPWTELNGLNPYKLEPSRIFVLNTKLEQGETVDADYVLNKDTYNQKLPTNNGVAKPLNLFSYQRELMKDKEPSTVSEQSGRVIELTQLYPGWTEDGELVDWFYEVTPGRHVLEPAELVPLDTSIYQAELRIYWMNYDFDVNKLYTNLAYLQTLTYFKNGTYFQGGYFDV